MRRKKRMNKAGLAVRRRVLGSEHVKRSLRAATDFDLEFQHYITDHVWGALWTRPGVDLKARSMITIAILAALGRLEELRIHIRATRNTAVTLDELREVLMHVGVYAGAPAGVSAFRVARETLAEMGILAER